MRLVGLVLTASFICHGAAHEASRPMHVRNPDRRTQRFNGARLIIKGERIGTSLFGVDIAIFQNTDTLAQAIKEDDTVTFKQLQASGVDPNWCYAKFGCSPLCLAVEHGAYRITGLLLEQGDADVHEDIDATFKHDTVLCATFRKVRHYRDKFGFDAMRRIIERLVQADADVLAPGAGNALPLSLFAACDVIPNKDAFPILHTLLFAIKDEEACLQARAAAAACAKKEAEQHKEICSRQAAMFSARAKFIENYPGANPLQRDVFDLLRRTWSRNAPECVRAEQEIASIQAGDNVAMHAMLTELLQDCNDRSIEQPKSADTAKTALDIFHQLIREGKM